MLKSKRQKPTAAIELQSATVTAIDAALADGQPDRDRSAFVERAVSEYFARVKRGRELRERLQGRTYLTDSGKMARVHQADARSDSGSLSAEAAFIEEVLRRFQIQSVYDGGGRVAWKPDGVTVLPLSAAPWLTEALGGVRAAANASAQERRKQTEQESGMADPAVRAAYNKPRAAYVERYGADRVKRAVEKAGRHQSRARDEYQRTEHFTAFEWLDLLGEFGFRCALCVAGEEAEMEPHHGRELHKGGANTIDNLFPACPACHERLHRHGLTLERGWLARQSALCGQFWPGQRVRYTGKDLSGFWWAQGYHHAGAGGGERSQIIAPEGEVVSIVPPEPLPGTIWEAARAERRHGAASAPGVVLGDGSAVLWQAAHAVVRWKRPTRGRHAGLYDALSNEKTVLLDHLEQCDAGEWLAEQQEVLARFHHGDMVRGVGEAERVLPGVIVRLLSPDVGDEPWQEARAEVYRPPGGAFRENPPSPQLVTVALERLERLDAAAWLADQQALYAGFQESDLVWRFNGPKKKQGRIIRLRPPEVCPPWRRAGNGETFMLPTEWVPWREGQALVQWAALVGTSSTDELLDLKGLSKV
jgi:hypothetical protein